MPVEHGGIPVHPSVCLYDRPFLGLPKFKFGFRSSYLVSEATSSFGLRPLPLLASEAGYEPRRPDLDFRGLRGWTDGWTDGQTGILPVFYRTLSPSGLLPKKGKKKRGIMTFFLQQLAGFMVKYNKIIYDKIILTKKRASACP